MDENSNASREAMIDCGDHSNYKSFFNFGSSCYFYKYVGPERIRNIGDLGFKYEKLANCQEVADLCEVTFNEATGKFSLKLSNLSYLRQFLR